MLAASDEWRFSGLQQHALQECMSRRPHSILDKSVRPHSEFIAETDEVR